jgi:hypothetical protein
MIEERCLGRGLSVYPLGDLILDFARSQASQSIGAIWICLRGCAVDYPLVQRALSGLMFASFPAKDVFCIFSASETVK